MPKKNYDSEFCGSLPLQFINQIQSYGVLVVLARDTGKIIQVSQNIEEMLGVPVETAVGSYWQSYLPAQQFALLETKIDSGLIDRMPFLFDFNAKSKPTECLAIVHVKEDYLLLEIEKITSEDNSKSSFLTIYQEIKYSMSLLESTDEVQETCQLAIQELKKLSGFDHLMVYQFDAEWNGTVVAEVREEGMESYLGLVFPASDVPRQARELYLKNPYRQIPDRNYSPVKLYPLLNPITEAFLDLSACNLRGVAGVHVEYLKNMNVMASMSTRILKDNKLWGLISCHHREAKFLSYEVCSVFELLSGIISAKLSRLQTQQEFTFSSHLQTIQSRLVEQLYTEADLAEGLLNKEVSIADLFRGNGAAITHTKTIKTTGATPTTDEIRNLIMWLQVNASDKVFYTSEVASVYDSEQLSNNVSGFVAIPVCPEKGEYIVVFRPEVIQQINWGGNPNEAINFEKDKKNYHPRHSFKLWQQTVKNTSLPWHAQEIRIAENFRTILLEYTLKKHVS